MEQPGEGSLDAAFSVHDPLPLQVPETDHPSLHLSGQMPCDVIGGVTESSGGAGNDGSTKWCAEQTCRKRPSYGVPGGRQTYCAQHKLPGMVDVCSKLCEKDGCNRRAVYGMEGDKPRNCSMHRAPNMVDLCHPRCAEPGCTRNPMYGSKGNKRRYCLSHKKDGMIDQRSRLCENPSCNKVCTYGFENDKRRFCAGHRAQGMVDLYNKRCMEGGCMKQPCYAFKGEKARFCGLHKAEGMFDVRSKRCAEEGCMKHPSYGLDGQRALRCKDHMLEGMINVQGRRCEVDLCLKRPCFGPRGARPRVCGDHREEGMVNVKSRACEDPLCNRQPSFAAEGSKQGRFCSQHRLAGMVDVRHRRCEAGCGILSSFALPGQKARFCHNHKGPGMIDVLNRKRKGTKADATGRVQKQSRAAHRADSEEQGGRLPPRRVGGGDEAQGEGLVSPLPANNSEGSGQGSAQDEASMAPESLRLVHADEGKVEICTTTHQLHQPHSTYLRVSATCDPCGSLGSLEVRVVGVKCKDCGGERWLSLSKPGVASSADALRGLCMQLPQHLDHLQQQQPQQDRQQCQEDLMPVQCAATSCPSGTAQQAADRATALSQESCDPSQASPHGQASSSIMNLAGSIVHRQGDGGGGERDGDMHQLLGEQPSHTQHVVVSPDQVAPHGQWGNDTGSGVSPSQGTAVDMMGIASRYVAPGLSQLSPALHHHHAHHLLTPPVGDDDHMSLMNHQAMGHGLHSP